MFYSSLTQIHKLDGVVDDGEMKEEKRCIKLKDCLLCTPFNQNKRRRKKNMDKINLTKAEPERIVSTVKSYPNHVNDLCKGMFKLEQYKV